MQKNKTLKKIILLIIFLIMNTYFHCWLLDNKIYKIDSAIRVFNIGISLLSSIIIILLLIFIPIFIDNEK